MLLGITLIVLLISNILLWISVIRLKYITRLLFENDKDVFKLLKQNFKNSNSDDGCVRCGGIIEEDFPSQLMCRKCYAEFIKELKKKKEEKDES